MSELTCGWTVSSLLTLTRIQGNKKKKRATVIWCKSFCTLITHPVLLHFRPSLLSFSILPAQLMYHGCISICVVVGQERGKRRKVVVAQAKTVLENSLWMSCLWMHHYQTTSWMHSRRLVPSWAKIAPPACTNHIDGHTVHANTHNNTETCQNTTRCNISLTCCNCKGLNEVTEKISDICI